MENYKVVPSIAIQDVIYVLDFLRNQEDINKSEFRYVKNSREEIVLLRLPKEWVQWNRFIQVDGITKYILIGLNE